MKILFDKKIIKLSSVLSSPLYAVGGYVRNYYIDGSLSDDIDLSGAIKSEELISALNELKMPVIAEYKRTGTVVFTDGKRKYEYTSFRKDTYLTGGKHLPEGVEFTEDISEDARRRDFKMNAVYYDIKNGKTVDPLSGLDDIKNKRIDTVKDAYEVFSHDGLRLMRLARFSAELDFTPTKNTLEGAKKYADNILDVSKERIYDELKKITSSSKKYAFSDSDGEYTGLKILRDTGVLEKITGNGDYGKILNAVKSAKDGKKFLCLFCFLDNPVKVLTELKADNKTVKRVEKIKTALLDKRLNTLNTDGLKTLILEKSDVIEDAIELNRINGGTENLSREYENIKKLKLPLTVKELSIGAKDLIKAGVKENKIGETLKELLRYALLTEKTDKKSLIDECERIINIK